MATLKKSYLYAVRMGESAFPEAYRSPYRAGYEVGKLLGIVCGAENAIDKDEAFHELMVEIKQKELGFSAPSFRGQNYIRLYAYEPITEDYDEDLPPEKLYEATGNGYEIPRELEDWEWHEFFLGMECAIIGKC